jgi:WD40 repeat protein
VAWSGDNKYLVTRNDNQPSAVWIWDMTRLELATVLLQKDPVKSLDWDPVHNRLVSKTIKPNTIHT